jgi:hypothetical protein
MTAAASTAVNGNDRWRILVISWQANVRYLLERISQFLDAIVIGHDTKAIAAAL